MEIIPLTKDKYAAWDNFCLESDDAWFWHTTDWLEYTLNYRPQLNTRNIGFFVFEKGEIQAVVSLTMESVKFNEAVYSEFSFGGDTIPAPAIRNDINASKKESVLEFIFNKIDELAKEKAIVRSRFWQTPLAKNFINNKVFNYFLMFNYIDVSFNTRIIDLSESFEGLWNNLRRNHQRNIEKGEKIKTKIYTMDNISESIFKLYKEMHHIAAGRKTRPDNTFDLMLEGIKNNKAFLAVAEINGENVGFEYYFVFKGNVYGLSAANDPKYESCYPIRHKLEWDAIVWMKKQGFKYYEIGWQQFGTLPYDFPDNKQINITHFKKGFGGYLVPLFRAEKYYSKEYFQMIDGERRRQFVEQYGFCGGNMDKGTVDLAPSPRDNEYTKAVPRHELEEIIKQILLENEGILTRAVNDKNVMNYFLGKIKGRLKDRFNFADVKSVLNEMV